MHFMSTYTSVDTRDLYTVALIALAVVVLAKVATRDWLGLTYSSFLLATVGLQRAGVSDRSRIGKLVYFILIAGAYVLVTLSFLSD